MSARQLPIAGPHQDRVVEHIRIGLAGSEVPHEESTGVTCPVDPPVGPALAPDPRQEIAVGPGGIGVGDHQIRRNLLAVCQAHALGLTVPHQDLRHLGLVADLVALTLDQAHQPIDQGAGPSHRGVHPPTPLQEGDQGVDGGHGEGVAPDQQGMEGQDGAQPRVPDMGGHHGVDAAVALEPRHGRDYPRHCPQAVEGDVPELLEAHPEDRLALGHEALVAGQVPGGETPDLRTDGLRVAAIVEVLPVVEADPIEGIHEPQIDLLGETTPAEPPAAPPRGRGP